MKNGYVETKWNVDENNVLHMEFPIELFLYVSDKDWVNYKNDIIDACQKSMKGNK